MPEDLKLSQIGSSQLPPPFRGLHSPGVRKHCQIIFACYFGKSSITFPLCACVRACVRARARVRVCVCVCVFKIVSTEKILCFIGTLIIIIYYL